jgi:hypothetical protein
MAVFIYSTNTLAFDHGDTQSSLLQKAEAFAISEVLSSSDLAFFKRVSAIPFLSFIKPMSVMDYRTRQRISQRTVAIIQDHLSEFYSAKTTKLNASETLYLEMLKQANKQSMVKLNRNNKLEDFKYYLLEHEEELVIIEKDDEDYNEVVSLYTASQIIEDWGIDPYDFAARPYYCALGIHTLDVRGIYSTRLCS